MEKSLITTGKTIDLAVQTALNELHLDRDSVSVEVLENAKSGFLGIGASPAKIRVTYQVPDEEPVPAPALSSASRSKPKKPRPEPKLEPEKQEPVKVEPPKQELPRQEKQAASADRAAEPEKPKSSGRRDSARADAAGAHRGERPHKPAKQVPVKEYAPAAPGSVEEEIEVFLKGLLAHMGSTAVPHAIKKEEDIYAVELVGENLGMLIGRRGDTLDAIQHLTNYAINRRENRHARINVDAECYRQKREESLQRLAKKVAGKVCKYRRNITLEPMNAYERHVIHAALQDVPDVTTYSTGVEPNRRIVVAYNRYKNLND